MRRSLLACLFVCVAVLSSPGSHPLASAAQAGSATPSRQTTPAPPKATVQPAPDHAALLKQYCVPCHNERLKTGGLALDGISLSDIPAGAEVWEKVIRKLRAGMMPPAGVPRPDKGALDSLVAHLETTLDRAALAAPVLR